MFVIKNEKCKKINNIKTYEYFVDLKHLEILKCHLTNLHRKITKILYNKYYLL